MATTGPTHAYNSYPCICYTAIYTSSWFGEEKSIGGASQNGKMQLGHVHVHVRRLCRSCVPRIPVRISYPSAAPSVCVFTAGAPGSGKTTALQSIYGLRNVMLIDLDEAIKLHTEYDAKHPARVYEKKINYEWANELVERRFQQAIAAPATNRPAVICVDGTGTHVQRQLRRMQEAKNAGFWVVQLFVRVSLDTALARNASRQRSVPHGVLSRYVDELEAAVASVVSEPDLVNEYICLDNEHDDGLLGFQRWGDSYDQAWRDSVQRHRLMDYADDADD